MLLSGEIMRGKFRHSLSTPEPMQPGVVTPIHFELPGRLHSFLAGHRIMIQIQSTWFPLYDRNPQKFLRIPDAAPGDFTPAVEKVCHSRTYPSHVAIDTLSSKTLDQATYHPPHASSPR